jgi:preprotein translocase subunit YajC
MTTPGLGIALSLAQASTGGGSLTPLFVQIAAIIAIFYFLMIRPQQRQRRKHEETLRAIKRGDEIVTAGGIIGEVIHIRETAEGGGTRLDDRITIKSGESRLVVERGRIARVNGSASGASADSSSTATGGA